MQCGGNAFPLDCLAGPVDPFDEEQLDALLGSVDFSGYQPASSASTRNKEGIPALVDRTSESVSKFVDIMGQKGSGGLADEEVDQLGGGDGIFLMGRTEPSKCLITGTPPACWNGTATTW